MFDFLIKFATVVNAAIVLMAITAFFCVGVEWQCGLCGKVNETGLFRFLFRMCKHDADFN